MTFLSLLAWHWIACIWTALATADGATWFKRLQDSGDHDVGNAAPSDVYDGRVEVAALACGHTRPLEARDAASEGPGLPSELVSMGPPPQTPPRCRVSRARPRPRGRFRCWLDHQLRRLHREA